MSSSSTLDVRGSGPESLPGRLYAWFIQERARGGFLAKAYAAFVLINLGCFAWAVATAYPFKLHGLKGIEYAMIGVSVSLMGALVATGSLQLTLWAIGRAMRSGSSASHLKYLALNVLISGAAAIWVLFAFMLSGWLVAQVLPIHESLSDRAHLYQRRLFNLLFNPTATSTLRTIYVGAIMGAAAMLPAIGHVFFALWVLVRPGGRQALAR